MIVGGENDSIGAKSSWATRWSLGQQAAQRIKGVEVTEALNQSEDLSCLAFSNRRPGTGQELGLKIVGGKRARRAAAHVGRFRMPYGPVTEMHIQAGKSCLRLAVVVLPLRRDDVLDAAQQGLQIPSPHALLRELAQRYLPIQECRRDAVLQAELGRQRIGGATTRWMSPKEGP